MASTGSSAAILRHTYALCEIRILSQNVSRPFHSRAPTTASLLRRPCLSSTHPTAHGLRSLHTTSSRAKAKASDSGWKDKKSKKKELVTEQRAARHPVLAEDSAEAVAESTESRHPTPSADEPLNFADVRSRLAQQDERAESHLKTLKAGGRFNADTIGAVRVQPDRAEGTVYPLRELAQIVPKGGRTISILVHEAEFIKPIMSAVQAHKDFNQQPQRDPDNELELIMKIELERREDVVKRVKSVCHDWRERVRGVRQKRDKVHVAWRKDGSLGPDAKRKVDAELEKIIKAKMLAIDGAEKEAMKTAEGK